MVGGEVGYGMVVLSKCPLWIGLVLGWEKAISLGDGKV